MTSQLRRTRPARRAPIDAEQDYEDDGYEDEPPWEEEEAAAPRRSRADSTREARRPSRGRDSDERPARGRASRRDDSEPAERPRNRAPERGRQREEERPAVSRGRGWDTLKDQRAKKIAGNAHRLQVKDKEILIHFLEGEPFAV